MRLSLNDSKSISFIPKADTNSSFIAIVSIFFPFSLANFSMPKTSELNWSLGYLGALSPLLYLLITEVDIEEESDNSLAVQPIISI